jgi:hypothetical protein
MTGRRGEDSDSAGNWFQAHLSIPNSKGIQDPNIEWPTICMEPMHIFPEIFLMQSLSDLRYLPRDKH